MGRMLSLTVAKTATGSTQRVSAKAESDAERARRSQSGLDWFSFFCANLQTGFGPFVSVYLTTAKWTQTDIGLVLMIGGIVGLIGQIPGGALVDRMRSKTLVAAVSVVLVGVAGLIIALGSFFPVILLAWVLHAAASCMLSPSITTVSLNLVGHEGISQRLGRNATFASVGSALAAGGMGAVGYYVSNQAVFFVTAALAVPALFALFQIGTAPAKPAARRTTKIVAAPKTSVMTDLRAFATDKALVVLAVAIVLYYLSNAAILPLIGSMLTLRSASSPTLLIAACIIVPQITVAILSPLVGSSAQTRGRRPLLLIGLLALPVRAVIIAMVANPAYLVAVQVLDGVTSAVIGVVVPLVAADATRNNGRYALAQGLLGTAMGLGASFSASLAGILTDRFGASFAFYGLTVIGAGAFLVVLFLMPETRGGAEPQK